MAEVCTVTAHPWSLCIEEGRVGLSTVTCGDECRFLMPGEKHPRSGGTLGDEMEWLYMPPISVQVRFATDCTAYDVDDYGVPQGPPTVGPGYESGGHYIQHGKRCDCNWWPVIIPPVEPAWDEATS
jgi:hypothetical protein